MAVVVQGLIDGSSLIVCIYLKGEPLRIEELARIGGPARIDAGK